MKIPLVEKVCTQSVVRVCVREDLREDLRVGRGGLIGVERGPVLGEILWHPRSLLRGARFHGFLEFSRFLNLSRPFEPPRYLHKIRVLAQACDVPRQPGRRSELPSLPSQPLMDNVNRRQIFPEETLFVAR